MHTRAWQKFKNAVFVCQTNQSGLIGMGDKLENIQGKMWVGWVV